MTAQPPHWFTAALAAAPGSPERDRFIFRPGRGAHGELPPNNWTSEFGGPAWTRAADPDGQLLSDADELRTSWPRIQAAFVDDPREAVADAAGLVEHAAQALTSALRQRQRQLLAMWDRDGMPDGVEYADSGGTAPGSAAPDGDRQAAADGPDTEQLRLLIQRYRRLFDQLSR